MSSFNSLKYIDKFVYKRIEKNPNLLYSGLFKNMRKKVPLIADYPVLIHIAKLMADRGIRLSQGQIYNASRYSKEYNSLKSGKVAWHNDIRNINIKNLKFENKERKVREGRAKHQSPTGTHGG